MMNRKEWKKLFPLCLMLVRLCSANFLYAADPAGNVVINEFMADNAATVMDQDGEYDDWIELYNKSSEAISLAGCHLTDKTTNLTQWTFPDGTTIAAGNYLIIWADEDEDQGGLHANFKLGASGESIVLVASDQTTVIDTITFGAQTTDVSTGRYPNGTGDFVQMPPTPAAANSMVGSGDVNGSTVVDLADAILALQVSVGITPSATLYTASDVNGDSRIGLPEAIYALRTVATQEDAGDGITEILLNGNSITVDGSGATAAGSTVTVTSAGTYNISGTLTDGQIIVNTADADAVNLVLKGINVTCSSSSPIYVISAEETVLSLADNTQNYVTDGSVYVFPDAETDEPDAAIFSKSDLDIEGSGSLTVTGNYSDGIASKDGLVIAGGNITVTSADDGIRGKDWLIVKDGNITVNAKGDGLKSTNDEDSKKGYISVENGTFNITAAGDGIQAETNVMISGGTFTLTTGGGSGYTVSRRCFCQRNQRCCRISALMEDLYHCQFGRMTPSIQTEP
ncbi:MAG: carbohydrate-binding domain-containing protein [Desulfobacterales bacterium]